MIIGICYEKESGSPYTRSIDRFVDAVEEINEIEVVVGATALIAIGVAIATNGASIALQAKI